MKRVQRQVRGNWRLGRFIVLCDSKKKWSEVRNDLRLFLPTFAIKVDDLTEVWCVSVFINTFNPRGFLICLTYRALGIPNAQNKTEETKSWWLKSLVPHCLLFVLQYKCLRGKFALVYKLLKWSTIKLLFWHDNTIRRR